VLNWYQPFGLRLQFNSASRQTAARSIMNQLANRISAASDAWPGLRSLRQRAAIILWVIGLTKLAARLLRHR